MWWVNCSYQNGILLTEASPSTPRYFFQVVEGVVIDKNKTLLCGFSLFYCHISPPPMSFLYFYSFHWWHWVSTSISQRIAPLFFNQMLTENLLCQEHCHVLYDNSILFTQFLSYIRSGGNVYFITICINWALEWVKESTPPFCGRGKHVRGEFPKGLSTGRREWQIPWERVSLCDTADGILRKMNGILLKVKKEVGWKSSKQSY